MSVTKINLLDQVQGYFKGTKAAVEALTGLSEGFLAYATDTEEIGSYNGSAWTWGGGGGGSFDLEAEIHGAPVETLAINDEIPGLSNANSFSLFKFSPGDLYDLFLGLFSSDSDFGDIITNLIVTVGDALFAPIEIVDGWISGSGTWSYTSADSPIFVMSVPDADAADINLGDRIKLTQTTEKYFIVHAKGSPSGGFTPVTIYGGTDYTLANAAISFPGWSHAKSPLGFPTARSKWRVVFTDSTIRTQAAPTVNVWYNLGTLSVSVPIGVWKAYFKVLAQVSEAANQAIIAATVSTTNNGETNTNLSSLSLGSFVGVTTVNIIQPIVLKDLITMTSKTTHYFNARATIANTDQIWFRNDLYPLIFILESEYL
jgi:hypothetical protein